MWQEGDMELGTASDLSMGAGRCCFPDNAPPPLPEGRFTPKRLSPALLSAVLLLGTRSESNRGSGSAPPIPGTLGGPGAAPTCRQLLFSATLLFAARVGRSGRALRQREVGMGGKCSVPHGALWFSAAGTTASWTSFLSRGLPVLPGTH